MKVLLCAGLLLVGGVLALNCPSIELTGQGELLPEGAGANSAPIFAGHYVRVFKNRLVMGGYGYKGWRGGMWVFRKEKGKWIYEDELLPDERVPGGYFGLNVDAWSDGTKYRIIGGHPFDTRFFGPRSGSANMFELVDGEWKRTFTFSAPSENGDGMQSAYFGYAVAVEGETAVIGARRQDDPDRGISRAGAVYIYERQSLNEWKLVQTLRGSVASVQYGDEVHLHGTTNPNLTPRLIVGSPRYRVGKAKVGRAYLYTRNSRGVWKLRKRFSPHKEEDDDWPNNPADASSSEQHFGEGIHTLGRIAVVGGERGRSELGYNTGSVYLYQEIDGKYQTIGSFYPDRKGASFFGQRVSRYGDVLVISAWGDSKWGTRSGAVYIAVRCRGYQWRIVKKIYRTDSNGQVNAQPEDEFGKSVSIDDRHIAIGCPKCDTGAEENRGASYVYRWNYGPKVKVP